MEHPPIGIDLGTSTSIICAFLDGQPVPIPDPYSGSPIVPSVVGLNRSGELLVGKRAVDRGAEPLVRESKRMMGHVASFRIGDKDYSPEEIAAIILRHLKHNAEIFLSTEIRDVVISVPANFEDTRRRATVTAAEMAGLHVVRLINEPTAAAIAYGINRLDTGETLLVYDFGGGTLDVSIVEAIGGVLDVKTSYGVAELGGKDFDEALCVWARGEFMDQHPGAELVESAFVDIKKICEDVKKELTSVQTSEIECLNVASYGGEELDLKLPVTRDKFNELVRPLVAQSLQAINSALDKAGMNLSDITKLVLVGGTTHIPYVRAAVSEHTGLTPAPGCEPDLAVAQGAAIDAARAADAPGTDQIMVQDVCTYGLGILSVQYVHGRMMLAYDPLIEKNTPIPFTVTRDHYRLLRPNQEVMEIEVVQDLQGGAVLPEDTVGTGASGTIENIPPSPSGEPHQVRVDFTYDVNGIVTLKASIPATRQELTIHTRPYQGLLTPEQALEATRNLNTLWSTAPLAYLYQGLIQTAENVLRNSPDGAEAIGRRVAELKAKISMNDRDGADAAAADLRRLLDEQRE
ncbi:MAG: Hsp70 family protein [Chthonomonadales bacterium]